jgi:hypothetical protein
LFVKDSHSFDSPNSSSFINGHCCKLVLDENKFNCNAPAWRMFHSGKGLDVPHFSHTCVQLACLTKVWNR